MVKVLRFDEIVNIDCGGHRCRECKYLEGDPGDYGCGLFGEDPKTYPGPFAQGEAMRSAACQAGEAAFRAEASCADMSGVVAELRDDLARMVSLYERSCNAQQTAERERDEAREALREVDMILNVVGADRAFRRMLLCEQRDRVKALRADLDAVSREIKEVGGVHVCEGGGPENHAASVAVTFAKLQKQRDEARAAHAKSEEMRRHWHHYAVEVAHATGYCYEADYHHEPGELDVVLGAIKALCGIEADRDAWRAKAEARPGITREDALELFNMITEDDSDRTPPDWVDRCITALGDFVAPLVDAQVAALRDHARKVEHAGRAFLAAASAMSPESRARIADAFPLDDDAGGET